ncbi:MAG: aldo/keto reductase [Chloroflexi bacterium]|nr:aldo/keto reductase [Chloroflexota bacterium]
MDPLDTSEIGNTGLRVTKLGLGGAPIGGTRVLVPSEEAAQIVRRALELGIRYFDTAPFYGLGRSESFYGEVLPGVDRDGFTLSTKVGRVLDPVDSPPPGPWVNPPSLAAVFDFSRDGIVRSFEESLQRLGLDRIDVLFIHDPDDNYEQAIGEAYPTVADLRSQGLVKAIGAGMNQWQMLARFAREGDFDCFLLAGRYTLLDQSGLAELLPLCQDKGISVVLGGPYNSRVLASDLSPSATFNYSTAPPEILERARAIKSVCDRHDVPLKAAALQFGLAHPAVAATIPGPRSLEELDENFQMVQHPIPNDLWAELRHEKLISPDAPTPMGG